MKIVLFTLNGSWAHSSLALRCLRRPLEAAGHEVILLEYTLKDRYQQVLEALYRERADLYGFSCYIWNLDEMLALGEDLFGLLPGIPIVLGGPEVSYDTRRFAEMQWINAIVSGEGEEAMVSLAADIAAGDPHERVIDGGKPPVMADEGILYRDGEHTGSILYYESSRGCPYSCAYCLSSATEGLRMKSLEQVERDLLAFEELKIPHKIIKFVDRTFNADPRRANAIWRMLAEERFGGQYHFEVSANLLNEESFAILERLPKGKIQLEFGLQSTNPETLKAVSRHIDPGKVLSAVERVYRMGNMHVHLDLIAGLPYEDYASFGKSFDDAYGKSHLLQLGFLKLLHGTRLEREREEHGYVSLSRPPYTVLQSKWISFEEMQRLQRIAALLERYTEGNGFVHTLWYLNPRMPSPFAFWEGLSRVIGEQDGRPLQKISQPDAYRYLWEYAAKQCPWVDKEELLPLMQVDFTEAEHKNPPWFLR